MSPHLISSQASCDKILDVVHKEDKYLKLMEFLERIAAGMTPENWLFSINLCNPDLKTHCSHGQINNFISQPQKPSSLHELMYLD